MTSVGQIQGHATLWKDVGHVPVKEMNAPWLPVHPALRATMKARSSPDFIMSSPSKTFRGTSAAGQHWVLEIIHDQDAESPRDTQENLGTLIYAHRRYVLGDERITQGSMNDYLEHKGLDPDKIVSLPVYLYDHSGLAMSTKPFGDPWDSGCVGAIFATFDKIDAEFGNHSEETLERVRDVLRAEISEMHEYLSGETYGFRAFQAQGAAGTDDEDEAVDDEETSVWGFIGSDPRTNGITDHLPDEAIAALSETLADHFGRLPTEPVAPPPPAKSPRPR